jgi:1,4-alpha-glucan branching enzyme
MTATTDQTTTEPRNSIVKEQLSVIGYQQIKVYPDDKLFFTETKKELKMKIAKLTKTKATKKKNAEIYGVRQVDDGVIFAAYYPTAGSVEIAGDFNNWQPQQTPMSQISDGVWKVKLPLSAGRYCYRLVVDNQWQQDPNNEATEPNPYGELNSVLVVS